MSNSFRSTDDPTPGPPSSLQHISNAEWEDTTSIFSPDILLAVYPDVTLHPTATGYGVGIGDLIAVDDSGQQIAVWADSGWKAT